MSIQNNISVAANNNDKIRPGHVGIAPHYNIYDPGKAFIERRLNPPKETTPVKAVGDCLK